MEEIKNLYLVKTKSFRAYVIAETTDEAWEKFKSWLEKGDGYGFLGDRNLDSIEMIASTSSYKPKSNGGDGWDEYKWYDMLFL